MSDYTRKAVERQLNYLSCIKYELGIYNRVADTMKIRHLDRAGVLHSLGYFKYMNQQGHDIFIRPFGPSQYIFIDDITVTSVQKMYETGCELAVALESSPLNYQGFVRVSNDAIEPAKATAIAKHFANVYDGDFHCADWKHFGRLAGFTNRKPAYVNEIGQYPFVSIYETFGGLCTNSASLLKIEPSNDAGVKPILRKIAGSNAEKIYLDEISRLKAIPWKEGFNSSNADWNAVLLLLHNNVSESEVADILYKHSESVAKRQGSRIESYITKTVTKATIALSGV